MTARTVAVGSFLTPAKRDEPVDRRSTYPMMGVRSFGRGPFAAPPLSGDATSYSTLRKVGEGDVVYPKLMAWEGAFALVPPELSGRWVSPEFCIFEVDESVADLRYVSHLLAWEGLRDGLLEKSSGTNARRRRLQPEVFLAHRVPLPNLSEQHRIARHLDQVGYSSARIGRSSRRHLIAKRALTERTISSVEAAGIPIREILELQRRAVDVRTDATYQEIGVRSFGNGLFIKPSVTGVEIGSKRVFCIENGDLVVSNVFGWEGAVAVANPDHDGKIGSHRFMTWTPRSPDIDVRYLRYYLLSEQGLMDLRTASPGSAGRNKTLSIKNFEAIRVPLPGPALQDRIVAHLDKLSSISELVQSRQEIATAILPAARNEVFSALR